MISLALSLIAMGASMVSAVSPKPAGGEILLGMSTALTGPTSELGLKMKAGVVAAFEEENRTGGVNGRLLRLVAVDDAYEPSKAGPNMRALVDEHNAVAIIGNVGTPTAVVAVPICRERKVAFFGAFTGAGILRKTPPDREVINFRASYAEETAAMVDALVDMAGISVDQIAFFTQRDAYGDAGFAGGIAAMKRHGLKDDAVVAHGRYERNTVNVESGLADILTAAKMPKAVIMVGTYGPCAKFIKLARESDLHAIFLNVSFVGAASLAKELGESGNGVIVTEVVPHPDSQCAAAKGYRAALKASDPKAETSHVSFEGYLVGRTMVLALRNIKGDPTREAVTDALESLGAFDLGLGVKLSLSREDHQASHTIWPSVIRNGKVEDMDWSSFKSMATTIDKGDR